METEFVVEDIGFRKFKDTPYIRRYDWWNSTEQIIKHYSKTYKDFKLVLDEKVPKWVQKLAQKGNVKTVYVRKNKNNKKIYFGYRFVDIKKVKHYGEYI